MTSPFLYSGFLAAAGSMPGRPALHVAGEALTYGELLDRALRIAATLQGEEQGGPALTAVFADRSATAFSGVLGSLVAGHGYVPLNPHFPTSRTCRMLQRSACGTLVVDRQAVEKLDEVLQGITGSLGIVVPDMTDVTAIAQRWPQHRVLGARDLKPSSAWTGPTPSVNDVAYLLFTSGSTGEPKGVPVTHANVTHFVNTMADRYGITADDRFSQLFDFTFDLSVFDMFVAWQRGASVHCPPRVTLLNPDRFVREQELTVWFSVPSVGLLMHRFGALKPARFPSLRWSLFCGEPLPVTLAEAWTRAAPASALENLYGPTELTVACTAYRWDSSRSPRESADGVVPIGQPLDGMEARVVDDGLREVTPGEVGELLMSGPQRTPGYLHDAEATRCAHVPLSGTDQVFYRTGDRVRKPAGGGPLTYVGRVDHQIKILGHRVELGEIESALRAEPGVEAAVAIAWPVTQAGIGGIAAFVSGRGLDAAALRSGVRARLQDHAVPQTIQVLSELPHNANGKVDRQALLQLLSA